jgi:hypothetical protein
MVAWHAAPAFEHINGARGGSGNIYYEFGRVDWAQRERQRLCQKATDQDPNHANQDSCYYTGSPVVGLAALRDPETNENRGNDDTFEKVIIAQLENEGIQQCILPRIPVYESKHVLVDCAKHTAMSLFLVVMFFAHNQVGKSSVVPIRSFMSTPRCGSRPQARVQARPARSVSGEDAPAQSSASG